MYIFYTTADCGDGSSVVRFFETKECINLVENADPETYGSGEGGSWFEVPDGTVITGLKIHTEDACRAAVARADENEYFYID